MGTSDSAAAPDYAPLIARCIVENPPPGMGTNGVLRWALDTWPEATNEQIVRAIQIADEIELADRLWVLLG